MITRHAHTHAIWRSVSATYFVRNKTHIFHEIFFELPYEFVGNVCIPDARIATRRSQVDQDPTFIPGGRPFITSFSRRCRHNIIKICCLVFTYCSLFFRWKWQNSDENGNSYPSVHFHRITPSIAAVIYFLRPVFQSLCRSAWWCCCTTVRENDLLFLLRAECHSAEQRNLFFEKWICFFDLNKIAFYLPGVAGVFNKLSATVVIQLFGETIFICCGHNAERDTLSFEKMDPFVCLNKISFHLPGVAGVFNKLSATVVIQLFGETIFISCGRYAER